MSIWKHFCNAILVLWLPGSASPCGKWPGEKRCICSNAANWDNTLSIDSLLVHLFILIRRGQNGYCRPLRGLFWGKLFILMSPLSFFKATSRMMSNTSRQFTKQHIKWLPWPPTTSWGLEMICAADKQPFNKDGAQAGQGLYSLPSLPCPSAHMFQHSSPPSP